LPHFVPNVGVRIEAGGRSLTYTGDAGPDDALVRLADDTDLLLAEATYVDAVPDGPAGNLNSAAEVGRQARIARARHLVLTHLWPGTDATASRAAARRAFDGPIEVATPGLAIDLG